MPVPGEAGSALGRGVYTSTGPFVTPSLSVAAGGADSVGVDDEGVLHGVPGDDGTAAKQATLSATSMMAAMSVSWPGRCFGTLPSLTVIGFAVRASTVQSGRHDLAGSRSLAAARPPGAGRA